MTIQDQITSIVDKYLHRWIDMGLNKLPIRDMQVEMADTKQDPGEEWRVWLPVKSRVTDDEIKDFEDHLGHKYPESYKTFLKHKHFYELQISEVSFCSHPINVWKGNLSDMIFSDPKEYLIDRGLIPFANYSDWGLLCFDTSKENTGEYTIALWDHERASESEGLYKSFPEMLIAIDKADESSTNTGDY